MKQDERNDQLKRLKTLKKDVLSTLVENKHQVVGFASEKKVFILAPCIPTKNCAILFLKNRSIETFRIRYNLEAKQNLQTTVWGQIQTNS